MFSGNSRILESLINIKEKKGGFYMYVIKPLFLYSFVLPFILSDCGLDLLSESILIYQTSSLRVRDQGPLDRLPSIPLCPGGILNRSPLGKTIRLW